MKKTMSKEEYQEFVKQETPNSNLYTNCIKAFLIGGLICVIGQALNNIFISSGLSVEDSSTVTAMILILASALLTGLDIYPKIAKHAGAGTLVPITGFANSVVAPALEAKTEGYVLGVGAKIFTIAGPVILFGTLASVIAGVVYWVMGLF